jgi:hypothetical protein
VNLASGQGASVREVIDNDNGERMDKESDAQNHWAVGPKKDTTGVHG